MDDNHIPTEQQARAKAEADAREDAQKAMAMLKKYHHVQVPDWVFRLKIPPNQKLILGLIWSYQAHGQDCYASLSSLGERLGMDKNNVGHTITALVNAGYVTKTNGVDTGEHNHYAINARACLDAVEAREAQWDEKKPQIKSKNRDYMREYRAKKKGKGGDNE